MYKEAEHRLSRAVGDWEQEIISTFVQMHPYIESDEIVCNMTQVDKGSGSGVGVVVVGDKIRVPVIVEEFKLKPLDVFWAGGMMYPMMQDAYERALVSGGAGEIVPETRRREYLTYGDVPTRIDMSRANLTGNDSAYLTHIACDPDVLLRKTAETGDWSAVMSAATPEFRRYFEAMAYRSATHRKLASESEGPAVSWPRRASKVSSSSFQVTQVFDFTKKAFEHSPQAWSIASKSRDYILCNFDTQVATAPFCISGRYNSDGVTKIAAAPWLAAPVTLSPDASIRGIECAGNVVYYGKDMSLVPIQSPEKTAEAAGLYVEVFRDHAMVGGKSCPRQEVFGKLAALYPTECAVAATALLAVTPRIVMDLPRIIERDTVSCTHAHNYLKAASFVSPTKCRIGDLNLSITKQASDDTISSLVGMSVSDDQALQRFFREVGTLQEAVDVLGRLLVFARITNVMDDDAIRDALYSVYTVVRSVLALGH